MTREVQLDGLIGPTHFFGGLAGGNVASIASAGKVSYPRAAALQGLRKMKAVHDLGGMQLVMPPHPRPALGWLKSIGFSGSAEEIIKNVARAAPEILPIIYSSSAMWAANAATTCASVDAIDKKAHLTPANLISNAHRALEAPFTAHLLKSIFSGDAFHHHAPLPFNPMLADEGAANHMRIVPKGGQAVHVFVYGNSISPTANAPRSNTPTANAPRSDTPTVYGGGKGGALLSAPEEAIKPPLTSPPHAVGIGPRLPQEVGIKPRLPQAGGISKRYSPRQQAEASRSIARLHQLPLERTIFLQQHPDAIDAGVFHNDVIATSNDHLLIYHERAYVDDAPLVEMLKQIGETHICKVSAAEISLAEAVKTYLFNSQILTLDDGSMMILAPKECEDSVAAEALIESWISDAQNPIAAVQYIDVSQSMGNGGGPACLRLRLWLNEGEQQQIHKGIVFSDAVFDRLGNWVSTHYPESLGFDDLKNPALPARVQKALLELENIVDLKGLYAGSFQ